MFGFVLYRGCSFLVRVNRRLYRDFSEVVFSLSRRERSCCERVDVRGERRKRKLTEEEEEAGAALSRWRRGTVLLSPLCGSPKDLHLSLPLSFLCIKWRLPGGVSTSPLLSKSSGMYFKPAESLGNLQHSFYPGPSPFLFVFPHHYLFSPLQQSLAPFFFLAPFLLSDCIYVQSNQRNQSANSSSSSSTPQSHQHRPLSLAVSFLSFLLWIWSQKHSVPLWIICDSPVHQPKTEQSFQTAQTRPCYSPSTPVRTTNPPLICSRQCVELRAKKNEILSVLLGSSYRKWLNIPFCLSYFFTTFPWQ